MTVTARLDTTGITICFILLTSMSLGFSTAHADDLPIYGDSLANGWENWSWNSTVDLAETSPVHEGTHSVAVTYSGGWGALYLHRPSSINLGGYERLTFWIHGGSAGNQQLRLVANGDGDNVAAITAQANGWTQATVALSDLGSPSSLSELYWQDTTGNGQSTFYLDDIRLISRVGPPPPGPALAIDVTAGRHTISEDIYGMNFAGEQLAGEVGLPVRRWGGNSTSRYNWQNDTSNKGSDWYFENVPEDNGHPENLPNGSAVDRFVEQDRRTATRSLITVPLIGWVAKRRTAGHPYDCGFKVSAYGPQQAVDPWDGDCGNGLHADGSMLTGNAPDDTSVAVEASFVTQWVTHLAGRFDLAENGGVAYYNLDNEPMLWNSTHRDVHPQPTGYDEIRDRTYQLAAAIKAGDPSAKTLGPAVWGWCAYFYSARDNCSSAGSDYLAHGSTPFIPWYLQEMADYEHQHGLRILDYVDLHIYPQVDGVYSEDLGSPAVQAARLRSTRQLWDPDYLHEGWINQPVYLIPRLKQWVASTYPGTKTAITEYSWGALGHLNGALAQADILGIFGREGLDLATLWGPPDQGQPGAFAFRMYRNYDGVGGRFGDVSVQATSADQEKISVYAAQRSSDHALTVMVINKNSSSQSATISLSGFSPAATAAVHRYSAANLSAIVRMADMAMAAGGVTAIFPGDSLTLLVVSPESGAMSGDADGNGVVELRDTIAILQVLSGVDVSVDNAADTSGDDQIGLAEAVYTLQKLAGISP